MMTVWRLRHYDSLHEPLALRTTVEEEIERDGETTGVVRGRLAGSGRATAFHPGTLPTDPGHLLSPARSGADDWPGAGFRAVDFAPAPLTLAPGDGPPHIRLDKAAEFLLGDKL